MKKFVLSFMLIMLLWAGVFVAEADCYSKEVIHLANKVEKLKDKLNLEYESKEDLLDTCNTIVKYAKYSRFNKWDLTSVSICESRLNPKAFNKSDGGKGLMQITKPHVYWKDELFWYSRPYNKDENIKAAVIILECNLNKKKIVNKKLAFKHYNGSTWRSAIYAEKVLRIKEILKAA